MEIKYTKDQIRQAFWDAFHKRGELFFDYLNSEKDSNSSTMSYWGDFESYLLNPKGEKHVNSAFNRDV